MNAASPVIDDLHDVGDASGKIRLGWRIVLTIILLIAIAIMGAFFRTPRKASAAPAASPAMQSSGDPLVLAFYYTWFDENTWTYDQLSDLPAQPYVSRDRAAMGRHIEQAQQAGIDGFLVAWYGPNGQFNQTEPNLTALLDEAAARNFKIGILFETNSPFLGGVDSVSGALQHASQVHMSHPAYLRVDGRPVTFFWRPQIYGVGAWQGIRSQVDPGYNQIWISEGVDVSYLNVFDGHYLYSNTWNPPSDLGYTNQKFADRVQGVENATGVNKFWVSTVMPGYNDVRIRPGSGFARDREGGAYYAQAWQAAIASQPNWVVITSFNEWPEGTYIEPSAAFGRQYLDLTANWSQQFKAGGGSPITAAMQPPASALAPAAPEPEPDGPTAVVEVSLLNLRAGPGADYELVGQAAAGAALPISGRHPHIPRWWRVKTADGNGWVYAPLVRTTGPLTEIPMTEK